MMLRRSNILAVFFAATILVTVSGKTEGGLGSLLGKAIKAVSGKGVSKSTNKVGSRAARTGNAAAGRIGSKTAGLISNPKAVATASRSIIGTFGTQGALAMGKLSPRATVRLGEMSTLIAKSPNRTGWLEVIAEHGNFAVDWLWAHKGGVFVGTAATAALLKPADFLATLGEATSTAITATGEQVIRPTLVTVASRTASSSLFYLMMTCPVIGGLIWWKFCRRRQSTRTQITK